MKYTTIPEKDERIEICTSHTCDNCPLSNVWCFEETETENKSIQQEFDFS
jgi:hypothetical protein